VLEQPYAGIHRRLARADDDEPIRLPTDIREPVEREHGRAVTDLERRRRRRGDSRRETGRVHELPADGDLDRLTGEARYHAVLPDVLVTRKVADPARREEAVAHDPF